MHLHEANFDECLSRMRELTGERLVVAADVITPGNDRHKRLWVAQDTTVALGLVHQLTEETKDCDRLRRMGIAR